LAVAVGAACGAGVARRGVGGVTGKTDWQTEQTIGDRFRSKNRAPQLKQTRLVPLAGFDIDAPRSEISFAPIATPYLWCQKQFKPRENEA
jgi:hypothetical protein